MQSRRFTAIAYDGGFPRAPRPGLVSGSAPAGRALRPGRKERRSRVWVGFEDHAGQEPVAGDNARSHG